MTEWPSKDPGESVLLVFKFANQMETTETIQTVDYEVTDLTGLDASPLNILAGTSTIIGTDVLRPTSGSKLVPGGLDKSRYYVKCFGNMSSGRRRLVDAILPVELKTGIT